jgi:hypothetical protein
VQVRINCGGGKGKEGERKVQRQERRNYARFSKTRYIRVGNGKPLKNRIPKKSGRKLLNNSTKEMRNKKIQKKS